MRIIECEQGTPDWLAARAGVVTASNFAECRKVLGGLNDQQKAYADAIKSGKNEKDACAIAKYKTKPKSKAIDMYLAGAKVGDYTDKAKKYAFRLAVERISGELLNIDQFDTWAMKRGRELEPEARLAHEAQKGILIEQAGLALTDDGVFGASVDGLIDDDGASEYKCFVSPESLMPILLDNDLSAVIDQVQGQLWVTERLWCDFVLYCPALKPINKDLTILTVKRDDNYIEALESDMLEFNKLVNEYENKLRG